jgi:hypothetical protein
MCMNWAQLITDNPFLILSIISGAVAATILLHSIMRSKLQNAPHPNSALPSVIGGGLGNSGHRPSVLDRITLLNRNLIQCPRCFTMDYAGARFCTRCGMPMQQNLELPRNGIQDVEVRHLAQDGSNQMLGLSMRLDSKTRIGVIIGIQNQELPEQVHETRD